MNFMKLLKRCSKNTCFIHFHGVGEIYPPPPLITHVALLFYFSVRTVYYPSLAPPRSSPTTPCPGHGAMLYRAPPWPHSSPAAPRPAAPCFAPFAPRRTLPWSCTIVATHATVRPSPTVTVLCSCIFFLFCPMKSNICFSLFLPGKLGLPQEALLDVEL